MNKYVLLWLEAPLQSWGFETKFGRRETLDYPTKSGVLGLILSAMGRSGEQQELLGSFSSLDFQVGIYPPKDNVPKLEDFHMVGSGYNANDPFEKHMQAKTFEGKSPTNYSGILTYRYYLQDMAFAVACQVPEQYESEIVSSLQCPTWSPYLGKKCCVPTEIIYQGLYENYEQAFNRADELSKLKGRSMTQRVYQGESDKGESLLLNDVPTQFGTKKRYISRYVTIVSQTNEETFS